jgi:hypothetical protein
MFIEDKSVIEKILWHLGLQKSRNHDPPAGKVSHIAEFTYDDGAYDFYGFSAKVLLAFLTKQSPAFIFFTTKT